MESLTRLLIWSNALMAASASGWVIVTLDTLDLPLDWPLISLAFLLTLAFYTRDRLDRHELAHDQQTIPQRTAWVIRHRAGLGMLVQLSFGGAILMLALRPAAILPLLTGLGFALSYTIRWLPWRGHRLGWKHLPGMKMPFVALLWTLTTVITPAAVTMRLWQGDSWRLATGTCLLIMVQILLNDLRDVAGDRASGTYSWPVLVGESKARLLGYLMAFIAGGVMWSLNRWPFGITAGYSIYLLHRYRREEDQAWRPWIEGQGCVAAVIALIS